MKTQHYKTRVFFGNGGAFSKEMKKKMRTKESKNDDKNTKRKIKNDGETYKI